MKEQKLRKAAIAAVMAYLEAEDTEKNDNRVNKWRHSGREIQMNNRCMVQTRVFNKIKNR